MVLDIDPRHGGDKTLRLLTEQLGEPPRTVHCLTGGGGAHLYYRAPEHGAIVSSLGPGVDVKLRGYVVAPPSLHPSGERYESKTGQGPGEIEVANLPSIWLGLLAKQPTSGSATDSFHKATADGSSRYGMAALRRECEQLRACREGNRNIQLNRTAFRVAQLAAGGELASEPARREVLLAALHVGLTEWEALRTLESGWSSGRSKPRTAPSGHRRGP